MGKELKRMNYFNGLFLESKDYNQDKEYRRKLQSLHNRYLHTWGIISGLDVKPVTDSNMEVYVTEGAAIDLTEEDLDGSNKKEGISRQILIYEGHPDNPIDLSEYKAGDNIYVFASYVECNADWECERGQGEEIHIWERGCLCFGKNRPEDVKKNILLARVIPKEVNRKAGDNTITETIIDSTCILYTDIDGSPLRVNAGQYVKVLALKKFIFMLGDDINRMPFIKTYLEKLESTREPVDSAQNVVDKADVTSKLEKAKDDLNKCKENVTTSDQIELKAVLEINKLDYLINLMSNEELVYLLKKISAHFENLISNKKFLDALDKIISNLDNLKDTDVSKADREGLADTLKAITADFVNKTNSETTTHRDKAVDKMGLIGSDLEKFTESVITIGQDQFTAVLKTITSDLVNLKNNIAEIEQVKFENKLAKSTDRLVNFTNNQKKFAEITNNLEKLIAPENKANQDEVAAQLNDVIISDLRKCNESLITKDQIEFTTELKTIISDLAGLKNNINKIEQKDFEDKLKKNAESLVNLTTNQAEEIAAVLDKIADALAKLMNSNNTADQEAVVYKLDVIVLKLEKCTENATTIYQKEFTAILNTIITDLENLKKNISEFEPQQLKNELKKSKDRLINLTTDQKQELLTAIEQITTDLGGALADKAEEIRVNLANTIDKINKTNQVVLNKNVSDLQKCINKVDTANQRELLYVLKKNRANLINLINNADGADLSERVINSLQSIESGLEKCTENIAKTDQKEFTAVLEKFKSGLVYLNDIDQKEILGLLISIKTNLQNFIRRVNTTNQEALVSELNKNMSDLENLIDIADAANLEENAADLLGKIRSDLEECTKNAAKINQKELIDELEKLKSGLTNLKATNHKQFVNSLKKIITDLNTFVGKAQEADQDKIVNRKDITDLVNLTNNVNAIDLEAEITAKLVKIKADLEKCTQNVTTIDQKELTALLKELESGLAYIKVKTSNKKLVDSLIDIKSDLDICTESAVVIDQQELIAGLEKFKYNLVNLDDKTNQQGLLDSMKRIAAGILNFINDINKAERPPLIYELQKNITERVNFINSVKETDLKAEDITYLETFKTYLENNTENVIGIDRKELIAVLGKFKSDLVYLEDKTNNEYLFDSVKRITADLVNFINNIDSTNKEKLANVLRKITAALANLTDSVNEINPERELIGYLKKTKSDLVKCAENVITLDQQELKGVLDTYNSKLENFMETLSTISSIDSSNQESLANSLKTITADLVKFINDVNKPDQQRLVDALRIITTDLVSVTNSINATGREDLLNKLEVNSDLVNFTNNVNISDDVDFNNLISKKKDGTINTEFEFGENFFQLNSKDDDTKEKWELKDGGMDVFRGGISPNPDARIVWSESEKIWKAGLENKLSPLVFGNELDGTSSDNNPSPMAPDQKWQDLINGKAIDELHGHGRLSSKKGTTLSVDGEGDITLYGDLVVNDKNLKSQSGEIAWYGSGKPFNGKAVDGPVLTGSIGGLLGTASDGQKSVLSWNNIGKVGIGSVNLGSTADDLDIAGSCRLLVGSNPLRITSEWTAFPDLTLNQAEICNDTTYHKALMIVGNQSAGQGRKVSIYDRLDVNGLLYVNGSMQMKNALKVSAGSGNNGIVFPNDPGGGSGDSAWIKYYPRSGEACTLEIGTSNDGDDNIVFMPSGNVGVNTLSPNDKLDVIGRTRILSGSNPIRFTEYWSGFPEISSKNAEICNDTSVYRSLMIAGNRSGGYERKVSVWDDLDVNGPLLVRGKFQVAGAIIPGCGNCDIRGIMFPRDPGGGWGDCAWIRYYSDTIRGGGENMTLEIGIANDSNLETTTTSQWVSTCPAYPNDTSTRYCGYYRTTTRTFYGNGGDRLRFYASGGTYIEGNFYVTSSKDYKENISGIGRETVKKAIEKLEPVQFNFKGDYSKTTLGFIAENVPNSLAAADKKAISPMEIITVLVGEVKEQEKALNELKKKVSNLKRKKK